MAAIDTNMKTSNGDTVRVKVPSSKGGSDRRIYINGGDSGFKLGVSNDKVYSNGSEVSKSLKDFISLNYWFKGTDENLFLLFLHFIFKKI